MTTFTEPKKIGKCLFIHKKEAKKYELGKMTIEMFQPETHAAAIEYVPTVMSRGHIDYDNMTIDVQLHNEQEIAFFKQLDIANNAAVMKHKKTWNTNGKSFRPLLNEDDVLRIKANKKTVVKIHNPYKLKEIVIKSVSDIPEFSRVYMALNDGGIWINDDSYGAVLHCHKIHVLEPEPETDQDVESDASDIDDLFGFTIYVESNPKRTCIDPEQE